MNYSGNSQSSACKNNVDACVLAEKGESYEQKKEAKVPHNRGQPILCVF
jgi:hypothetical protein